MPSLVSSADVLSRLKLSGNDVDLGETLVQDFIAKASGIVLLKLGLTDVPLDGSVTRDAADEACLELIEISVAKRRWRTERDIIRSLGDNEREVLEKLDKLRSEQSTKAHRFRVVGGTT